MKKVGVLGFSLVFLLIFLLSSNTSLAQDLTVSPSPKPEINYELPYPGLLPDNPLYIFRTMRDRIVSFLISDPSKKAEFNLLQADKRLNAGSYLLNSSPDDKKINLAISTISKAENYFSEAISNARQALREGKEISGIAGKLMNSSVKHQQVLISLKEKSPQNFKESFAALEQRAADFESEVKQLTLKK